MWRLKVFDCSRFILSFWLMLLLKVFSVKCPFQCLTDYLIVYILFMIHLGFVWFSYSSVFVLFIWGLRVSNSQQTASLIWWILFLSLAMAEISSAYSCYITMGLSLSLGWSCFDMDESSVKVVIVDMIISAYAYLIIIFFVKCSR